MLYIFSEHVRKCNEIRYPPTINSSHIIPFSGFNSKLTGSSRKVPETRPNGIYNFSVSDMDFFLLHHHSGGILLVHFTFARDLATLMQCNNSKLHTKRSRRILMHSFWLR